MPILKPIRGTILPIRGHPLTRPLVGCWLMNEGSGNKLFDLSGNGNTGSLNGDPQWVAGKFGVGLDFDGTGDYVLSTGCKGLPGPKGTFAAWIYPRCFDPDADKVIFRLYEDANNKLSFYTASGDLLYLYIMGAGAGTNVWTRDKTILDGYFANDVWMHIAVTWDTTTDSYHVYKNGIEVSSSATNTAGDLANCTQCALSARQDGDYTASNIFDHVMALDYVLIPSEIAHLYKEPFSMFERAISPSLFYAPTAGIVNLAGSLDAQSSVVASTKINRKLIGNFAAQGSVTATSKILRKLSGSLPGQSGLSALVKLARELSGSLAASSNLTAALKLNRKLAGSFDGLTTLSGTLSLTAEVLLAGSIAAVGSIAGGLKVARRIIGQTQGTSDFSAALKMTLALAGSLAAAGDITGAVKLTENLAGQIAGQSDANALLTVAGAGNAIAAFMMLRQSTN